MKRISRRLSCSGLGADPNPHEDAPRGAMDIADNAVFRRPGTAEPRPGFCDLLSNRAGFLGFDTPQGAIAHEDDVIVQDANGEMFAYCQETDYQGDGSIVSGAIGCRELAVRGHSQGEALYFCGVDNMRKLYTGTERTVAAGAPMPVLWVELAPPSGSSLPIQAQSYVAYRATISIEYDERIVTSVPSARCVVHNVHATDTMDVTLRVYLPDEVRKSAPTGAMYVHIYRSKNSTVASPPDELFEAYPKTKITTSHVTAGYVELQDNDAGLPDAKLGAALYTNPSRETMARANARPPGPRDIQTYAGSTFLATPRYPQRVVLRWKDHDDGDRSGIEGGIGWRLTTCDTTAGDVLLENVADFTGLRVGQLAIVVTNELDTTPGPLYITDMDSGAGTVTLNAALEDTQVGATVVFHDALYVYVDGGGAVFPISTAALFLRCVAAGGIGQDQSPMTLEAPPCNRATTVRAFGVGSVQDSEYVVGVQSDIGANRTVILERTDANGAIFTYACTHGGAMNDGVPNVDEVAPEDWAASDRPETTHCLAWSKNGESEHFTEGGYLPIGIPSVRVLRIFALLDGLYILKARGDGIYRLTGFGERSGWRVQQISATASLVHGNLACSTGEAVYAWTTEGALEIGPFGIRPISVGLHDTVHRYVMRFATWNSDDLLWWCIPNVKDGEVLWGLQSNTSPEGNHSPESVYVFNYRTRCWSRWFPDEKAFSAAAVLADVVSTPAQQSGAGNGLIVLLPEGTGTEEALNWGRCERTANYEWYVNADQQDNINIDSVADNGVDVTIDGSINYTPEVGDTVVEEDGGSVLYAIVAVEDATHFTVDAEGLQGASGLVAFKGYPFRLRWLPEFGGGPVSAKRFEAVTVHCESTFVTHSVQVEAKAPPSERQEYAFDLEGTLDDRSDVDDDTGQPTDYPEDIHAHMNADSSWGQRLNPGVYVRQAGSQVRVSGVTIEYRDAAATRGKKAG